MSIKENHFVQKHNYRHPIISITNPNPEYRPFYTEIIYPIRKYASTGIEELKVINHSDYVSKDYEYDSYNIIKWPVIETTYINHLPIGYAYGILTDIDNSNILLLDIDKKAVNSPRMETRDLVNNIITHPYVKEVDLLASSSISCLIGSASLINGYHIVIGLTEPFRTDTFNHKLVCNGFKLNAETKRVSILRTSEKFWFKKESNTKNTKISLIRGYSKVDNTIIVFNEFLKGGSIDPIIGQTKGTSPSTENKGLNIRGIPRII